jgi:hypothetical protein
MAATRCAPPLPTQWQGEGGGDPGTHQSTIGGPLALAHEFVYTSWVAQPYINIAVRVDPAPMPRATTIKAGQHCAVFVQHTDAGR